VRGQQATSNESTRIINDHKRALPPPEKQAWRVATHGKRNAAPRLENSDALHADMVERRSRGRDALLCGVATILLAP